MADYCMNPFDFVPMPIRPKAYVAPAGPRWEGVIHYTLQILTDIHITGQTRAEERHFKAKAFYRRGNIRAIPGSEIRGMLSGYIEAITGSDLRAFTRGNEKGHDNRMPYARRFGGDDNEKGRHVGFLIAAADHPLPERSHPPTITYNHNSTMKTRNLFERTETLNNGFGQGKTEDAARFLFGHVRQEEEIADQTADTPTDAEEQAHEMARKGRLIFEDVDATTYPTGSLQAWDIDKAIIGSPNPSASTAWYFTSNTPPRDRRGTFDYYGVTTPYHVWEILADKVRGRKFYYHQDPRECFKLYQKFSKKQMFPYDVETLPPHNTQTLTGRLYFKDLPEEMLRLVVNALELPPANGVVMAHKIGALRPFGFGSLRFAVDRLEARQHDSLFAPLTAQNVAHWRTPQQENLYYDRAKILLGKILQWPDATRMSRFKFQYPPFTKQGFAQFENANGRPAPTRGNAMKPTMFFDYYQEQAENFRDVMRVGTYNELYRTTGRPSTGRR